MRGKAKQRPREEWIVVPGTHEAIIEPERWKRVQELLKQRTRCIDFEQNVSVFAGFLKCADCGRAMVKRQFKSKDKGTSIFYTCGAYSRSGTEVCSKHHIRHEVLERIVLDDLNAVIGSVKDIKNLIDSQRRESDRDLYLEKREAELVKERIQKVERLKRECYLDYKEGLLSKDEYLDVREDCLKQECLLQAKLDVLTNAEAEQGRDMLDSPWINNLLECGQLDALDRDTVVEFLEKIEIGEKDADNQQNITIHYRFSDELKDLFQLVYDDL